MNLAKRAARGIAVARGGALRERFLKKELMFLMYGPYNASILIFGMPSL
jgi:hypothetical protein